MPSGKFRQPTVDSKTSQAAIWSLVFGVLSFCLWILGSIPALILGTVALVKINGSQGRLQGKGLAIAGLVTGGLGLFVGLMMVGMGLPVFMAIQESAESSREMDAVKKLLVACHSYALDNENQLPASLQDLYPEYIDDEALLKRHNKQSGQLEPYTYFAGHSLRDPVSVLVASPANGKGLRAVGFTDGHLERMIDKEYQQLLVLKKQGSQLGKQRKIIKQLVLACYSYAAEHEGNFPETLEEMFPAYLDDVTFFEARDERGGKMESYIYFPGLSNTSFSKAPLVACPFVSEQKRMVGFVGGQVKGVSEGEYQKLLKDSQGNR